MSPKARRISIIIVIILLIAFLLYYFLVIRKTSTTTVTNESCSDGSPIPSNGDCSSIIQGYVDKGEIPPVKTDGNGCIQPTSYRAYTYPLSIGMKGVEVKRLQMALNVKEDGYFGCNTQAALIKATGKNNITKAELDYISPNAIAFPNTTT